MSSCSTEDLKEDVYSSLTDILEDPSTDKYNCHEMAEVVGEELRKRNHGAEDVEGRAGYRLGFLMDQYQDSLNTDEGREIIKKFIGKEDVIDLKEEEFYGCLDLPKVYRQPHSWVETEDRIVDFVPVVRVPGYWGMFGGFTIVGEKKDFGTKEDIGEIEPEDLEKAVYSPSDGNVSKELKV